MASLETERREEIKALISRMTVEEKAALMLHESMGIQRLGIPPYNWWNEALHGIARNGTATVFPQAIALAATFDTNLATAEYEAISDEARAKYNLAQKAGERGQFRGLTFWTPNVNIARDPRWGRVQETFGEDPFLTSSMGAAAVRALQGSNPDWLKTAACAKHFAVHSGPESTRHTADVHPSKKDLWETYLPAFKALVDAGVESVMGAYNRVYGEPCCASRLLLVQILRKKWKFRGHVVSDCWAVQDFHQHHAVTKTPEESAALAIRNGCDLNCGCTYRAAVGAVRQGLLSEEHLDASVERLLMTRMKLGMMDSPDSSPWRHLGESDIDSEEHRSLARRVASESIVLLRNKGQLLPLSAEKGIRKILVTGPAAGSTTPLLGNYYGLNPRLVTILEGIAGAVAKRPQLTLDYHPGVGMYSDSTQRGWTVGMAESADVVIACFGLDGMMEGEEGDAIETERGDRDTIELPEHQLSYLRAVKARGTPVVLVLTGGSAIAFPEDCADAILFAWYPGEEGGNAVADIIFGDAVPSGHLPLTFPASTQDLPPFDDYSMAGRTYRYATKKPLYPFGFGLSYVKWQFDKMDVTPQADGGCTVCVRVQNCGTMDARETVQLYVEKEHRGEGGPLLSLCAVQKISVGAHSYETAEMRIRPEAFMSVSEDGSLVPGNGTYRIIVSDSAPTERSAELGAAKPLFATVSIQDGAVQAAGPVSPL